MRFIGSFTTHYPIPTSAPAKGSGKLMSKEGSKQFSWKLPAIIGGPILVGLGKQDIYLNNFFLLIKRPDKIGSYRCRMTDLF